MSDAMLIAAAVTWDELWGLTHEGAITHSDLFGFAADEALAELFDVELGEDAETAAVQMADVSGLTFGYAERRVLVAQAPKLAYCPAATGNSPGAVRVSPLLIENCLAFFTGPSDAAAIEAAKGLYTDEAWELPVVQKLLAEQPLEWHDISELDAWLEASQGANHDDDEDDGTDHLTDTDSFGLGSRP